MSDGRLPAGLKFGALINPNSRRNRRRPPDVRALLAAGAPVEAPESVAETRAALARLAAADVEALAVSGGDGAVMDVLTAILIHKAFPRPPVLCIAPAGTTNMTAGDVGFRAPDPILAAAETIRAGGGRTTWRPVLRLDGAKDSAGDASPRAGMFFGAIAICRAIAACRRRWHARGVFGAPAHLLTLAPVLLKDLFWRRRNGLLEGAPATVRLCYGGDAVETIDGEWAAMMASTLDRLSLGMRPFWGDGPADGLNATFVRAPPERVALNIGPLLFGERRRPKAPGYISRRATSIEIDYRGEVTLDGELYRPADHGPYRLSIAGEVAFLTSP